MRIPFSEFDTLIKETFGDINFSNYRKFDLFFSQNFKSVISLISHKFVIIQQVSWTQKFRWLK